MEEIFLETERLRLRKMDEKDFGELAKMLKNPRVMYAWEYDFDDNDVFGWILLTGKNIMKQDTF